ncbi:acetolactate decarboxylase [Adhaeribacter sp. BT258]|uniref:Acetolactate decarboxylase n=1 Tax=Adhaeribacter terrigena TaxID=2793070 RepID=A0ABS1C2E1_9BACT|nr:acetolactate decarboxylase [Adhaeribacter terrigena]MBK0403327.1 acetolactate decarboxylase [Adhaeribacter terrigena]
MKYLFYLSFLFVFFSCSSREPKRFPVVKYAGAMRNVTENQDTTNHIYLDTINPHRRLYGLGPLQGMTGEILIIDGRPYASKINAKGRNRVRQTFEARSPYFVYAHVKAWDPAELPEDSILDNRKLGMYLEELAKERGIDVEKPFPFMLQGEFRKMKYHVSYMPKKKKKHMPPEFFTEENADVIIIGFFSKHHQGVFTEPGSNVVMSFMTTSASHIGQIDQLTLKGKRVQLLLPEFP